MISNLIKQSQAGNPFVKVSNTAKKYVEPQNKKKMTMVDGHWQTMVPNRKYYAETPELIRRWELYKAMGPAALDTMTKYYQGKILELAAKGGPKLNDPPPQFDDKDTDFRGPAIPSSSALGWMQYNPMTEVMAFKFRTKTGLSSTTYSAMMNANQVHRWLKSASIGKYFNRYLKGKMVRSGLRGISVPDVPTKS